MKKLFILFSLFATFACTAKKPSEVAAPNAIPTQTPQTQTKNNSVALHIQQGALSAKDEVKANYQLLLELSHAISSTLIPIKDEFLSTDHSRILAGKKSLPSVLSVFSPSKDSEFVSVTLLDVLNGTVMGETSLPRTNVKAVSQKIGDWIKPYSAQLKALPTFTPVDFLKKLVSEKNCEGFNQALEGSTLTLEDHANLRMDYKACKTSEGLTDNRQAQVGIKSTNLNANQKEIWLKTLENSKLLKWIQSDFPQNTQIFIRCEQTCKEGELEMVVSLDAYFRKILQFDSVAPSAKVKTLAGHFLEYRQSIASQTSVPPLPAKLTFQTENNTTISFDISGSSSNPNVDDLSQLDAFLINP